MLSIAVDTNVLFQAVYSSAGASHEILRMVRAGDVKLALSVPVFEEYRDVLPRPSTLKQTRLTSQEVQAVLDFVALVGLPTPIDFLWRPNLRDESDNMFVELAMASDSRYLITRNIRDHRIGQELKFDSFEVVTPHVFLEEWRRSYGS